MKIGYIGLGAMGGSLARHLVAGHDLVAYDLNPANLAAFSELGARVAASPRELARASDVVIFCLPRSANVETVLFGPDGIEDELRSGKLVIDQTSGVPAMTIGFAERLARRGVPFLDAPLSGGVPAARNRTVTILASGPDEAWKPAEPLLRDMSAKVLRCSARVGDGQALKLINNALGACYRLATLELVAVGRRFGVPLADMVSALNAGSGASFTSRHMLVGLLEGRSTTDFAMTLMVKDLNGALDLGSGGAGLPMPLTSTARGLMQAAIGLFGEATRLDEIIPTIEKLCAVRFVADAPEADPLPLPSGVSQADLVATLTAAAAACNLVAVLEGVRTAEAFGLDLASLGRVIEAGSAWCAVAAPLLASLAEEGFATSAHRAEGQALEAASRLAAQGALPFLMPGIALALWRAGAR